MSAAWWWTTLLAPFAAVFFWTLLIRVVPSILGTGIVKHIEHKYDRKLEEAKAELQASYSTLKPSVDFLAGQPELRSKMIEAVEKLWNVVLALEKEFGDIIFLDSILLSSEINESFQPGGNEHVRDTVQQYKDFPSVTEKLNRTDNSSAGIQRLFVGDRLWLIFSTIVSVYGRFGFLIYKSVEQKQYISWKDDSFFMSIIENVLPSDIIGNANAKRFGGLRIIIAYLQAEFLKEATRVMSGSQRLSESLSDIQATVQNEASKIAQDRLVFKNL